MSWNRKRTTAIIFFGIGVLFISTQLFAYRPLGTEDAGVGAMGEVVVETAWERAKEDGDKADAAVVAVVLGLGRAELAVEGPYMWFKDELGDKVSGIGDLTVFGKVLLLGADEESGMFTVKAEAKTTTGDEDKGLGSGKWEYAGSAVLSKSLAMLTFHFQGGYAYLHNKKDEEKDSYFYGAAVDLALHDKFSLVAEFTGSHNANDYERPRSVTGGFIFAPVDMLAIDAGVSKGLTDEADDWVYTAGLTFVF